jgi:hypothetical protein
MSDFSCFFFLLVSEFHCFQLLLKSEFSSLSCLFLNISEDFHKVLHVNFVLSQLAHELSYVIVHGLELAVMLRYLVHYIN